MDNTSEPWTLEYSDESARRGLYPWHVQPLTRTEAIGPAALGWRVVFTGTGEECFAKLRELVGE